MPFSRVHDNSREIRKVIRIPNRMNPVKSKAEKKPEKRLVPVKKIVMRVMRAGKRPLQGTKLFVRIAISRSLGESMIRQPVTPAALQPNPMHMGMEINAAGVSAFFERTFALWTGSQKC